MAKVGCVVRNAPPDHRGTSIARSTAGWGQPALPASGLDNLFITPHTAWSAVEARQRLLDRVAENIAAFRRGERVNRVD